MFRITVALAPGEVGEEPVHLRKVPFRGLRCDR